MQFTLALSAAFVALLPAVLAAPANVAARAPTPVLAARAGAPSGVPIHPLGHEDKCLDVQNANFANGTLVQIFDCNDSDAQKWYIEANTITTVRLAKNDGEHIFCLDAGSPPFADQKQVHIWECKPDGVEAPQQNWFYTEDNHLALANQNPGFCLDLPSGSTENGNVLQIWNCGNGNPANEVWSF